MSGKEGVTRIRNIIAIFQKWMNSRKIGTKIALFYFVLLMFVIAASSILYQKIYSGIIYGKVGEMSMQTLDSISSNINTVIENADKDSKAIFTNDDLQRMLKNPKPYLDLETANRVKAYLIKLTETMPDISSVYLFDHMGNRFAMDKVQNKTLAISDITKASWFRKAEESKGYYILRLNAGGIFDKRNEKNFISLIRVINDLQNQQSIGYLVANIPEEAFVNSYKDLVGKYGIRIILLDENDRKITEDRTDFDSMIPGLTHDRTNNSRFVKMNRSEYQMSYLKTKFNWKIISIAPFRELSRESGIFSLIAFLVIVLNSVLLFLGSIFISRLVTNPVKKLLNAMKGIENNQFGTVDLQMGSNEFEKLQDGYNRMVIEIQKLIKNILEEQKIKRKAELDVLQAQIKPHFLYNTFDAISYLALEGRSAEVYTIMKALGSYYRTSLSKGNEVITLREEVEVVKNYLTIQKIRYNDLFVDSYEIEDGIENIRILKLVLQPLVENALYHGIKPKGERGHICIKAARQGGFVIITVRDDGVGMREETIREILSGRKSSGETSFGLKGTIERLRIFYGVDDVLSVKSPPCGGTEVILAIPSERCDLNE
jgi:two-component system sensor histidine kinase YesM